MSSSGILILSAPSGGGKTSLARALAGSRDDVSITVSHTTRGQRPGEENGVHYYFVDKPTFKTMIAEGQFIEYATVFDNYYGTSIESIEKLILNGKHAILDIDWQGAKNVRKKYPAAISVFVIPPSTEVLEQRLQRRKQDSDQVIARRMKEANNEMSHKDEFDAIIINDHFDSALAELESIVNGLKSAIETAE
ncbi:guanylate kinase [Candidatus Spongiihabitans sp.]|uniref:guanylate kinase n=1 Tax=Candidatus Spongiihabitans sp. TaxID=3101308 RepID=UPI003C6F2255